jgi:type I restriction enzyme R subunit
MKITREIAFEDAIVDWLVTSGGYTRGLPTHYDPAFALDTAELFTFVGATQADIWEDLVKRNGGDPDLAQRRFTERLAKQIDERGTIDVLRHGVEDLGVHIRLAFFRPASGLNPDLRQKYDANRLTVTRQLHYAPEHANALDLVLFVNGLPVATAELKNPLTPQSVEHAMAQYRTDRDPRDALLGRRAIVHFAVDPGLVMMTTKLDGKATRFLPFNRGSHPGATACGKGNPANPDGYATSYLWEWVWERHAWLDILNRFVHLERRKPGTKSKAGLPTPRSSSRASTSGMPSASWSGTPGTTARGGTTWSSTRPAPASRTRSPGSPTGWRPCTTRPTGRCSTRSWWSPTVASWTGSCRTPSRSSSTPSES